MGERRFYIREFDKDGLEINLKDAITESELKKRLDLAFRAGFATLTEEMDWDKVIDILINGEVNEPERDGYLEGIMKRVDEPSTDKWEEWIQKFPWFYSDDVNDRWVTADKWSKDIMKWFREMPR